MKKRQSRKEVSPYCYGSILSFFVKKPFHKLKFVKFCFLAKQSFRETALQQRKLATSELVEQFIERSDASQDSRCWNILKFVNKIQHNICKNKLIKNEEKLLITISGGQDSMCLLLLLYVLQIQMSFQFDCISMNHFWQKSSFFTMLHVSKCNFCFFSGLKLFLPLKKDIYASRVRSTGCLRSTGRFPLKTALRQNQVQSEEKARNWRHTATHRAASFYEYHACTQGHSKSDRIETILFNFMRGTGITGVSTLQWIKKQNSFSTNKKHPTLLDFVEQTHFLPSQHFS